jgi:tubulin--tyrosine ligase-like protein 12
VFLNSHLGDDIINFQGKWINQFPNEICIVSKDNLANTIQCAWGVVPWLQETYDLKLQLSIFYGAHKRKERLSLENTWIIKPPNMARSMDMVVTNNLDIITRLVETGPKIAQKYIEWPLTLRKKKIDFRFVVIVRSIEPLEVFLYKIFWIRSANIDYTMDVKYFTKILTYIAHSTSMRTTSL